MRQIIYTSLVFLIIGAIAVVQKYNHQPDNCWVGITIRNEKTSESSAAPVITHTSVRDCYYEKGGDGELALVIFSNVSGE